MKKVNSIEKLNSRKRSKNNSIIAVRKKAKQDQVTFAKALSISQGYLSKIEAGLIRPNEEVLFKLIKVYRMNINKYLTEEYGNEKHK